MSTTILPAMIAHFKMVAVRLFIKSFERFGNRWESRRKHVLTVRKIHLVDNLANFYTSRSDFPKV